MRNSFFTSAAAAVLILSNSAESIAQEADNAFEQDTVSRQDTVFGDCASA